MLLIEPCIFIFNILCQKCPRLVTQPSHSTDGGIKNMNFVQKKEFETLACLFIIEKKWGFGRVTPMPHRQTDNRI